MRPAGAALTALTLARIWAGRRIPLYVEWEVTGRCNLNCSFCSTRSDADGGAETDPAKASAIVDQLAGLGSRMIHFSGGEPTLRRDLGRLIRQAKHRGLLVSVTTNGTGAAEQAATLAAADLVRVSIDGPRDVHDRLRGRRGVYDRAVALVDGLLALGRRPMLTAVYTPDSDLATLTAVATLAAERRVRLAVNVMGRNINRAIDAGPSRPDVADPLFGGYLRSLKDLKRRFGPVLASAHPMPAVLRCGGLDRYGCRAMDIALCLKPDGRVSLPCNGLPLVVADGDIKAIFYGPRAARLRRIVGRHRRCRGCTIKCMASASSLLRIDGLIGIAGAYLPQLVGPLYGQSTHAIDA